MIFLKIYDRIQSLPRVIRVEKFPCILGRSVKHPIVIDHPSISSDHIQIDQNDDGSWTVRDLGSTNGMYFQDRKLNEVQVRENMALYLGPVRMELIVEEEALEKTEEFFYPPLAEAIRRRGAWRAGVWNLVWVSCVALVSVVEYLLTSYELRKEEGYASFLSQIAFVYGLASVLAVGSKIHTKQYQFLEFLKYSTYFGVAFTLYHSVSDLLAFNLEAVMPTTPVFLGLGTLFMYFIIYRIAGVVAQHAPRRHLKRDCAVFLAAVLGLIAGARTLLEEGTQRFDFYGAVGAPWVASKAIQKQDQSPYRAELDRSAHAIGEFRARLLKARAERDIERNSDTPEESK